MYGVKFGEYRDGISTTHLNGFGEVFNLDTVEETSGAGQSFCDGQTSPIPPQYAYDKDGVMYFENSSTAKLFSDAIRKFIVESLPVGIEPVWTANVGEFTLTTLLLFLTKQYNITESQAKTAINAAINYFGYLPDEDELEAWLSENRDFDLNE